MSGDGFIGQQLLFEFEGYARGLLRAKFAAIFSKKQTSEKNVIFLFDISRLFQKLKEGEILYAIL